LRPEGSALGVRLKKRHSALLVVHLEPPNFSPRALIGAFSGATEPIGLVLTGPNTNGRDMQFLRAMLDQFNGSLCIDKDRIFSAGWSFGGMMSLAVGREMGGIFRAVAPMSGALWTPFNDSGKPMAAWIAHGIYDDFVNYSTVGIEAKNYYVAANHCSNNTVPRDPSPCVEYQNCDAGHPVVWCPFFGHHGTPDFAPWAIWNFFNRF